MTENPGFKLLTDIFGKENVTAFTGDGTEYYKVATRGPIIAEQSTEAPKSYEERRAEAEEQFAAEYRKLHDYLKIEPPPEPRHENGACYFLFKVADIENEPNRDRLKTIIRNDPKWVKRLVAEPPMETSSAVSTTDSQFVRARLKSASGGEDWRLISTESGPAYQTVLNMGNPQGAAYAICDVIGDMSSVRRQPKDTGKVTIPASVLTVEKAAKLRPNMVKDSFSFSNSPLGAEL